jgi:hypothetical protein
MFSLGSKKPGETPAPDWKSRLKRGLALTGDRLKKVAGIFRAHPAIDDALYDDLEAQLLAADVGVGHAPHRDPSQGRHASASRTARTERNCAGPPASRAQAPPTRGRSRS